MSSLPRRSLGGAVVENSLRGVGFEFTAGRCALVETRRPARRAFTAVLAQNAWNVISRADFDRLATPYPPRMVARMRLRRMVAHVNLRRAERVVCLSEAMAELVQEAGVRADRVVVAPAYLALDMTRPSVRVSVAEREQSLLVPGTVTWYKAPAEALTIARERGLERVRFAGPDDGSGCWSDIEGRARRLGLRASRETLSRDAMRDALASAALVVLPSQLESLGFSVGEALCHASEVVASPLPAHREAAAWMGVAPTWLSHVGERRVVAATPPSEAAVRASWTHVGEALGLPR